MTSRASSTIERRQSFAWSQSWPAISRVPKWPTSSRSAASCSSTRAGLPAMIIPRLIMSIVTASSGTSRSGLTMKSALRSWLKLNWKNL